MLLAISKGVEAVKSLLASKPRILRSPDDSWADYLVRAINEQDVALVSYIVSLKPNVVNFCGPRLLSYSPLFRAIILGNIEMVAVLLQANAVVTISERMSFIKGPYMRASSAMRELLFNNFIWLTEQAVGWAAESGDLDHLIWVLSKLSASKLTRPVRAGFLAAMSNAQMEVVEYLAGAYKVEVLTFHYTEGYAPLIRMLAAGKLNSEQRIRIADLILDHQPDQINKAARDGRLPVTAVTTFAGPEVLRYLVGRGLIYAGQPLVSALSIGRELDFVATLIDLMGDCRVECGPNLLELASLYPKDQVCQVVELLAVRGLARFEKILGNRPTVYLEHLLRGGDITANTLMRYMEIAIRYGYVPNGHDACYKEPIISALLEGAAMDEDYVAHVRYGVYFQGSLTRLLMRALGVIL